MCVHVHECVCICPAVHIVSLPLSAVLCALPYIRLCAKFGRKWAFARSDIYLHERCSCVCILVCTGLEVVMNNSSKKWARMVSMVGTVVM